MKHATRWLALLASAAIVGIGFWPLSAWLEGDVRARLNHSYREQIASLSEHQATVFVRRLSHNPSLWLELLVAASADERPAVAAAVTGELRDLVDRWAELTPQEHSPQVAELAHLLAQQAPLLPADRRHLAHSLAQRLIEWPVDGRVVDAARLIDDCRSVLVLPRAEPAEIRVAAVTRPPSSDVEAGGEPPAAPVDSAPPAANIVSLPVTAAPANAPPLQPASPPPSSRPEPRPFQPAAAQRISDD